MDGIDMPVEIVLVADLMLPKPPLPNRTFPVFFPGWIHPLLSMEQRPRPFENPASINPHRFE